MPLPNVLVIGAPRSGTSSLYSYLKQHPEVFMSPVKEARFFAYEGRTVDYAGPADAHTINRNTVTRLEDYRALFDGRTGEPVYGEASPIYLYNPDAAANIRRHVPDCRLLCILRNPVERAYSDFLNMVRLGWEPLRDFAAALRREEARKQAGWGPFYHYRSKGYYGEQIARYLERFDREQLRIYRFEDFQSNTRAVMQDVYGFLGVDTAFVPEVERAHNRSGLPKSDALHRLLTHPVARTVLRGPLRSLRTGLRDLNTRYEKPPLDPAVRTELQDAFQDDLDRLEGLIDRDLSAWKGNG
jgi:hypothetical protein